MDDCLGHVAALGLFSDSISQVKGKRDCLLHAIDVAGFKRFSILPDFAIIPTQTDQLLFTFFSEETLIHAKCIH